MYKHLGTIKTGYKIHFPKWIEQFPADETRESQRHYVDEKNSGFFDWEWYIGYD